MTDPFFSPPGGKPPGFFLEEHPNLPPPAIAPLGVHSSSNGFHFSPVEFGYEALGWVDLLQRIHLNVSWLRNAGAANDEREDRFKAVIGCDIRLGPDTLLLADYIWEQEVERGITSQIAEIGIRQMIHPLTAIGAGIGFGLDNESPDVHQATLGFLRSF